MKKNILIWLAAIAGVELLSGFVIFHPSINTAVAIAIACAILIVSIVRPTAALSVLAVELMIGSMGSLFKAFGDAENNGGIPIRILIFAAFLLGWFIWALRNKTYRVWRSYLTGRAFYPALAVLLVYAFVIGWINNNHGFVLGDANAWGLWLLLLPVIDLAKHKKEEFVRNVAPAVLASLCWLPVKTIILFYFFSHGYPDAWHEAVYLWVRRTGVGEVTRIVGSTYRVFFQSHIYAVIAFVGGLILLATGDKEQAGCLFTNRAHQRKWLWIILWLSLAEILISLSRSFWIGVGASILISVIYLLRRKSGHLWKWIFRSFLVTAGATAVVTIALLFPIPKSSGSLSGLFASRTDLSDSASASRWQLMPVLWGKIMGHPIRGSGFGASLTYQSNDPRVVAATGGTDTTYAFEWGWMDFWYKFGILGPLLMLGLLWSLCRRVWKAAWNESTRFAVVLGVIALAVVHFFTPYLNHPLGFAVLIAIEGVLVL